VIGFRAASWSVTRPALWALDAIAGGGLRHDASLFRRHASTGSPRRRPRRVLGGDARRHDPARGAHARLPLRSLRLPHGGGFYLRVLPLWAERLATDASPPRRPALLASRSLTGRHTPPSAGARIFIQESASDARPASLGA
jgi:hypothetical protein